MHCLTQITTENGLVSCFVAHLSLVKSTVTRNLHNLWFLLFYPVMTSQRFDYLELRPCISIYGIIIESCVLEIFLIFLVDYVHTNYGIISFLFYYMFFLVVPKEEQIV